MSRFAALQADLRLSLVALRRAPTHALAVVLTLALGVAVCAAMYSVVYGVMLKSLDYPEAERLVVLGGRDAQGESGMLSGAEAESLSTLPGVEHAGYFLWGGVTDTRSGEPTMRTLIMTGGEFFKTLGVAPLLGRGLGPQDMNRDSGVVISHALWQEAYGGDPDVIGQPFHVDWVQSTVVGVMPPDFAYPAEGIDLWIGHDLARLKAQPALFEHARFLKAIGRTAPGVTPTDLDGLLTAHSQRLAQTYPGSREWRLTATTLLADEIGEVGSVLLALFAIAALALLVACANVVNLVLLRGVTRAQDLAVHQALGASRGRLARQLALETLLLGGVATGLGILGAVLALRLFVGLADSDLPRADEIGLDLPALAVVIAIGLAASLGAALLPAWQLARDRHAATMQAGGGRVVGGRGSLSHWLPIAACAVSVGGLSAALLLAASVRHLERMPLGYDADPLLMLTLFHDARPDTPSLRGLLDPLGALPGVEAAASLSAGPLSPLGSIPVDLTVVGRDREEPLRPRVRTVAGPIDAVLGLRLHQGRWFGAGDHAAAEPVALVNRRFAERVFGSADALDQRISLPPFGQGGERREFRIVGIMEDARLDQLSQPSEPEVWLPDAQYPVSSMALLLRAAPGIDPGSLLKPAQQTIWAQFPQQGIYSTRRVAELRDGQLATPRFFARNAGAFALLALLLAAIGVHAVVAFQLACRRREFALRLALGAAPHALAGRVLATGLALGLPAAALGALLGYGFAQILQSVVVGIEAGRVLMPALAAALLLVVVVLASLRSMGAALRVQPITALRAD
ncbi:MAG: ABC transporter permease [Xanthomonadales bacterium]|nr:ABC transporter permease [Xanthomonadales bacterium]